MTKQEIEKFEVVNKDEHYQGSKTFDTYYDAQNKRKIQVDWNNDMWREGSGEETGEKATYADWQKFEH